MTGQRDNRVDLEMVGGQMGALIRTHDFSESKLGPRELWPQSLRTALSICLSSRFPMIIFWGPHLCVLYNDAYIPIFAKKHPGILGKTGFEAWGEVWDVIDPMFKSVMERGEATWSEDQLLLLERKGFVEEVYLTWSYSPISDESGGVGGVFTAVFETTERVLGERRLRTLRELGEQAAQAKTTPEACQAAIATLGKNQHDLPYAMLYLLDADATNLRLAAQVGVSEGTAASPLVAALNETAGWPLAEAVRSGEPQIVRDVEPRLGRLPGGVWPEASHSAVVLPIGSAEAGRSFGVLVAGTSPRLELDASYLDFLKLVSNHLASALANAHSYEEERRRAEALTEIDRAKTAFFSNVSHEFRTPLTLMLGPIEDALRKPEHALAGADLDTAHRNSLRLLKLVNSLLDFSRIEAGRAQATYQPTDLAGFTRELAGAFEPAMERAGLRYDIECKPLPQPVFVDVEMWEKIVPNLISNAFKFTFEGSVQIRVLDGGDCARLEVEDTGIGIAAEDQARLFERFQRVEGARSRTHEGTGIGLALVQELVKMHGGTIQVSSEPGRGTRFIVLIPYGVAHLPQERIGATRLQASTALKSAAFVEEALRWLPSSGVDSSPSADATHAPTAEPRARVLVADDNADMRGYLSRLLSEHWAVEAVANGAEALVVVRQCPPDLVLADVMMPMLDGFGLVKELRADARMAAIPIILLSRVGLVSGLLSSVAS